MLTQTLLESLECRRLLSGSPHIPNPGGFDPGAYGPAVAVQNSTTLTVNNAHDVQITEPSDGTIEVTDKSSSTPVVTDYSGVSNLVVNGTKGGDIIFASLYTVNTTVNGNGGADEIGVTNNNTANIVVNAGNANDLLSGQNNGTGTVVINGQGGRDQFTLYGSGPVVFNQKG